MLITTTITIIHIIIIRKPVNQLSRPPWGTWTSPAARHPHSASSPEDAMHRRTTYKLVNYDLNVH